MGEEGEEGCWEEKALIRCCKRFRFLNVSAQQVSMQQPLYDIHLTLPYLTSQIRTKVATYIHQNISYFYIYIK